MTTASNLESQTNEAESTLDQQMVGEEGGVKNGWKPALGLLAVNLAGATALHFGEPTIPQNVQVLVGGTETTEELIRIARNSYGGIALGIAAGAVLASSDGLPNRFIKKVSATASYLGVAGLGVWAMSKFGTEMGERASVEGTAQKSVLIGSYLGGRNLAQSHPYGDTRHPGMSASPVARSAWYYRQLAQEKFKNRGSSIQVDS